MIFIPDYNIDELKPADYNPRKIDEEKIRKLEDSLRKYSVMRPLIITSDNLLLAGPKGQSV
jgi:ParB-like chromosome segregation protein Spo0J